MPFDTLTLRLTWFLTWGTILSSYPTNTYFHSWHEGPDSYRLSAKSFLRRNDEGYGDQVLPLFGHINPSQGKGEGSFPTGGQVFAGHNPAYHQVQGWYHLEERVRSPTYPQPVNAYPQQEFGRTDQGLSRRVDTFPPADGDQFTGTGPFTPSVSHHHVSGNGQPHGNSYGVQSIQNICSSQAQSQNERVTKSPKVPPQGPETSLRSNEDERINFEESSRSLGSRASPREGELPGARIVTPKSGTRRPTQGGGGKHQASNPSHVVITTTFRNQTQKGSKRPSRPNDSKPQSGDIVFPDVHRDRTSFVPRVTKCGKKTTFCEHIGDEYPSEYINQVLKREGAMFREFFGQDVISDPNITERIHAPEENSLCPFRQEVVFPRVAKNKDDKWLFVVNQDQYVQGVTVEVCLNPESRCMLTEGFPLGYTPYCKQKYIERRLVAIGEDGKPHSDSFRLPSCCNCVVKHDSSARMTLRNLSPSG